MISLLFWCLAAACCAVMDTLQYHFYSSKIYYTLRKPTQSYWWNPEFSWKNKYIDRYPPNGLRKWLWFDVPFTDAWHTFKSLMIVFICLSIATINTNYEIGTLFETTTYQTHFDLVGHGALVDKTIDTVLVVVIYGIVWNVVFNLFYNKILIKK